MIKLAKGFTPKQYNAALKKTGATINRLDPILRKAQKKARRALP